MTENPANAIKDLMWKYLMDRGQKSNIPALKEYVYDLIGMTTQKTAGQKGYAAKQHIDWDSLDMTLMSIAIEATALVLSGDLEQIQTSEAEEEKLHGIQQSGRACHSGSGGPADGCLYPD